MHRISFFSKSAVFNALVFSHKMITVFFFLTNDSVHIIFRYNFISYAATVAGNNFKTKLFSFREQIVWDNNFVTC